MEDVTDIVDGGGTADAVDSVDWVDAEAEPVEVAPVVAVVAAIVVVPVEAVLVSTLFTNVGVVLSTTDETPEGGRTSDNVDAVAADEAEDDDTPELEDAIDEERMEVVADEVHVAGGGGTTVV